MALRLSSEPEEGVTLPLLSLGGTPVGIQFRLCAIQIMSTAAGTITFKFGKTIYLRINHRRVHDEHVLLSLNRFLVLFRFQ